MQATNWQPTAEVALLRKRAEMMAKIREFFAERGVLEVETPLLSHATVPDPYILSIAATVHDPRSSTEKICYLQTSPEYAMKRLLAAGSGCIYQICKAFRQDELGRIHNPEFTMLEWYRLGFDHHALMDEVDEFLQAVAGTAAAERCSYQELFEKWLNINPHEADLSTLENCARQQSGIDLVGELDRDGWLNILMSHCIEPKIGQDRPIFVYDFPASQAALSRVRQENPPVASRVEVYFKGIELANGFHELQSEKEQRSRFLDDLAMREKNNIPPVPIDERLLGALSHGLPECSGIALGIDRLIMLATDSPKLEKVMSFDFSRA